MTFAITKTRLFFSFFLVFLILTEIGIAEIKTDINFYKIDSEGKFIKGEINNFSISYFLNSKEEILKYPNKNEVILNQKKEIFCWSGCNLVPKRYISRIDIKKDNELLSRHHVKISKEDINQKISIILDKKIGQKSFEEEKKEIKTNIETDLLDNKDLVISYNGILKTDKSGEYIFFINITGGASIFIDKENIFNDLIEPKEASKKIFALNLTKGEYYFNINYWTNNESSPNLFWKYKNQENFEIISDKNLIYLNGSINKKEEYKILKENLILSSVPESYTLDYTVYPSYWLNNLSSMNNRQPILMVHGLKGEYPYWNNITYQLNSSFDVWGFYYSPANSSNFLNAGLLKLGINEVLSNCNLSKLDIVSHSMGGLISLGYIHNIGKSKSKINIDYSGNIRKLITIGSPLQGSYLSNRIITRNPTTPNIFCYIGGWLTHRIPTDIEAQAYLDLAVGSEYTWILNRADLNENISYLNLAGNKGITCIFDETKENNNNEPDDANDGLVAVSSSNLLSQNIPLIVLNDYDHANEIGETASTKSSLNVQHEVNIITSFLNGDNVSTIKSLLDPNDCYIDPNNTSSNPYTKGSVVLKILPAGDVNTASLRNINSGEEYNLTKWQDLVHGTQTNNWFYFSNNLNLSYSHEKYGLTFPAGTYNLYVNGVYKNKNVEIQAARTTMEEINLNGDDDNDGTANENDLCPQETSSNLPQNTETEEYYLDTNGCHVYTDLESTKWPTYNKNQGKQNGTGYFNTRNLTIITNSIEGMYYQPLVDDIDGDGYNEIVIFSGNYLKIFGHELNLIDEKFVGNLEGQFDLSDLDKDGYAEIIAVVDNKGVDNFTIWQYNGSITIKKSFDVTAQGGNQQIRCVDWNGSKTCIFKDYNGIVHGYSLTAESDSEDVLNVNISGGTSSDVNIAPVVYDFNLDGKQDSCFMHHHSIRCVSENKTISFDVTLEKEPSGLVIAQLDNGDYEIITSVSKVYNGYWNYPRYKSLLKVYNSDNSIKFQKEYKQPSNDYSYYTGEPIVLDYDNNNFLDVCSLVSYDTSNTGSGNKVFCYASNGSLLFESPVNKGNFSYSNNKLADMDNDNELEIINELAVLELNLSTVKVFNSGTGWKFTVADIDKNGALDLILTKNKQTKLILDNYGTIKILNLSINPINPSVDEDFNCSFILTGYDIMTANITWYKNNIKQKSETATCNKNELCTSPKIIATQTSKDEEWKCSITATANRKKSLQKSKSVVIKDSTEFTSYSQMQSGRSYFYGAIKTKTNSTIGMNFKPLTADIDQDDNNELIIFSKDNLIVYDKDMELKNKKQVGSLQGQPTIYNIDSDSPLEIVFISKIDGVNYFFAYQYNETFTQEFNLTVNNSCSGSGIRCALINNEKYCFFKDNKNVFYKINMGSQQISALYTNNQPDTTPTIPSILDYDNNGKVEGLWWFDNNSNGGRGVAVIELDTMAFDTGFNEVGFIDDIVIKEESGTPNGNLKSNPVFYQQDKAGGYEILIAYDNVHYSHFASGNQCYKAYLRSYDTDGTLLWTQTHNLGCTGTASYYNDISSPIIFDINGDDYNEVCYFYLPPSDYSINNSIYCLDRFGGDVSGYPINTRDTVNHAVPMDSPLYIADLNHDGKENMAGAGYIWELNGTILSWNYSVSSSFAPVPVDIDKNGALDLIWTKQNQTTIFYGNCLNDKDNDSICDSQDGIEGNSSRIATNIGSLGIFIDNINNLNRKFTGKKMVEFKQGNVSLVSFNFNFSKKSLNLGNITIKKQNHTNFGSILIKGISLDNDETKTAYIDSLNASIDTVCIKDAELNSIVEISRYCNGEDEFLVKCNSTIQNGYNCTIMGNRFKITGLKNSGVQQQQGDNIPPTITLVSPINTTYTGYFHINASLDEEGSDCLFNLNSTTNSTLTKINSTFFSERVNSTEGYYRLNVYCNDTAGNIGNNSVYFTATDNKAPLFTSMPNQTWDEDKNKTLNLSMYFSDPDNDVLGYFSSALNNISVSIDNSTGITTLTPDNNFNGVRRIIFTATDNDLMTNSNNITLTINEVADITINGTKFNGATTNFSSLNSTQLKNISNMTLEYTDHGKIIFLDKINLSSDLDFDSNIEISNNLIFINSTSLQMLNKSAVLYLYNLIFTNPRILRNNEICPETICAKINYSGGNLIFNVTQFSSYSGEETQSQSVTIASGGGSSGSACTEVWKCSDWDECNGGAQSRSCSPTYNCKGSTMPSTSQPCLAQESSETQETGKPSPQKTTAKTPPETKPTETEENPKHQPMSAITGSAITNIKNPSPVIGSLLSSFIVFGGIVVYRKFL